MEEKGFKQLVAWQKGYRLSLEIYRATGEFPASERFGMVSQMRRAAVAVPANIAEGYNRQHRKEYIYFLSIAYGSLAELETYLLLATDLGYLRSDSFTTLNECQDEVARLVRGLLRSLREPNPGPLNPRPSPLDPPRDR